MKFLIPLFLSFLVYSVFGQTAAPVSTVPPVPYSGKVAIRGANYIGEAEFGFSLRDGNGIIQWRNGGQSGDTIKVNVQNGRYNVLLGGQGMNPLSPELFLTHDKLYLKVEFDNEDGTGLRHLAPDQLITATPRALIAEVAKNSLTANAVKAGAVTKSMLGSDVLADLNRTVTPQMIQSSSITTAQLNEQILKYLKPEITLAPQAPGLIFNGQTITLHSRAEGKYLNYQWYKNGQAIAGADKKRHVIEDVNGTRHDGNYTLVVSNDFGSITTQPTSLVVDGTPTSHTVASISMDMIFCPPGTFTMGSPTSETGRGTDETQHQVTLTNGFYLGKYEVTQAQYQTVMNGNSAGLSADPSQFKGSNRPVEKASWEDAQIFLTRLNSIEQSAGRLPNGWKYVLPTEAEWEYASRGGLEGATYSWGQEAPERGEAKANTWQGLFPYTNFKNDGFVGSSPVGCFAKNGYGLYDMTGNVWEWTDTSYGPDHRRIYGDKGYDPQQPGIEVKTLKGGSFLCSDNYCQRFRPAARQAQDVTLSASHIGFRTAK